MQVKSVEIPYNWSDEFRLYTPSDDHMGTKHHAGKALKKECIDVIKADKRGLWIHLADKGEFITPSDPRWDTEVVEDWVKPDNIAECQTDYWCETYMPIQKQCAGLLEGNHEDAIRTHSHVDVQANICKRFGVDNLGYACFIRFVFKRRNSTEAHSFTGFFTHGSGCAITKGAKLNRLQRIMESFDADLYACLHPKTKVLSSNLEWMPIGDVKVGDELLGVDEYPQYGLCRGVVHTKVLEVNRRYSDSYLMELNDGTEIITTAEHPWLNRRRHNGVSRGGNYNWYRTDKLRIGDKLLRVFPVWDKNNSWGDGYIAGLLDGEGSITVGGSSRARMVAFAQKEGLVLDYYEDYLQRKGIRYRKNLNTSSNCYQVVVRKDATQLIGGVQPIRLKEKARALVEKRLQNPDKSIVTRIIPSGRQEVVTIKTDSHTFIAEGLATHNCGHMHDLITDSKPYLTLDSKNRIKQKEKVGAVAGCWFSTYTQDVRASYGEKKTYPPTAIGSVVFTIKPLKGEVSVSVL
uniref:Hint domain-containing protein n=2 Tax=viral metagenome TaxID=1070528 RepID=A0A6M3LJN3_9ZZZZ